MAWRGKIKARIKAGSKDPPGRFQGSAYEKHRMRWRAMRVEKNATAKSTLERRRGYSVVIPRTKVGS